MATITGLTAVRMLAIEAASVISGLVRSSDGHLILTKKDGSTVDAGSVVGPQGPQGPPGTMTAASAGGDLTGSTYPNPVIAPLKVTTAKIADLAVTDAKIANGTITDGSVAAANKDGAANKASMRTLGTGAQQAAAGNHTHLSLANASFMDRTASAVQSIPDSAFTKVLLPNGTLENIDYSGGDFTINFAGVYLLTPLFTFAANATGRRILLTKINGAESYRMEQSPTINNLNGLSFAQLYRFNVGDTFNMTVWQNSGAALNSYVTVPSIGMQAVRVAA